MRLKLHFIVLNSARGVFKIVWLLGRLRSTVVFDLGRNHNLKNPPVGADCLARLSFKVLKLVSVSSVMGKKTKPGHSE